MKACEIDDLINNFMFYCTYLFSLTQSNKNIYSGNKSPQQTYSCQDKQSYFQWFDDCLVQPLMTRWWAMTKNQMSFMQRPATNRIFLMKCCTQKQWWNKLPCKFQTNWRAPTFFILIFLVTICTSCTFTSEITIKICQSVPFFTSIKKTCQRM